MLSIVLRSTAAVAAATAVAVTAAYRPAHTAMATAALTPVAVVTTVGPAPTGNIGVYVPPVPPHAALAGLCRAFLRGARGHEIQILEGATGGTEPATTAWCTQYLKR